MRIFILWPSWSGKSTLAQKLGYTLKTPTIHLDDLYWKEGWVMNEDFFRLRKEAIAGSEWIMEWGGPEALTLAREQADLVVLLNTHPLGNIYRVFKRILESMLLNKKRIGLSINQANRLNWLFLSGIWYWREKELPKIQKVIQENNLRSKLIEITSTKEAYDLVFEKIRKIQYAT